MVEEDAVQDAQRLGEAVAVVHDGVVQHQNLVGPQGGQQDLVQVVLEAELTGSLGPRGGIPGGSSERVPY